MNLKFYIVFCVLSVSPVNCKGPGLKTRITDVGLTYADTVAIDQLSKSVKGQRIPDQSGRSGKVEYDIKNIVIQSFSKPSSSITVISNGLRWEGNGLGLSISGEFKYKWRNGFIPISDHGNIDVSVSGVNFNVDISLGVDGNGCPKIASKKCDTRIGSVHVKFHGGAAWIYNLFKGIVEDALKKQLNGQLCTIINKAVNNDANKALAKLKVTVDIAKVFSLDYRFIGQPAFNPQHFLETYHEGAVYWTSNKQDVPFDPPLMPPIHNTNKMFSVCMSTYPFNTLTYEAQKHGMLVYNLTAKDLPPKDRGFLNTTCNGAPCIGSIIPQIGMTYPNRHVQMFMSSGFSPKMSVTDGKVNVLCGGIITMTTTKDDTFLLSLNATMRTNVGLNVGQKNAHIYAKVDDMSIELHIMNSKVGKINDRILNFIANTAIISFVKPQLNKLGAKGIPLPVTDNVSFLNTQITLEKDTLMIDTDIKYQ